MRAFRLYSPSSTFFRIFDFQAKSYVLSYHRYMAEKQLSNAERMKLSLEVEPSDFFAAAAATFDERFGEWHVTFFRFDYFHFFTRELSEACRDEALRQAYVYMRVIAGHAGQLNICGSFIDGREDIRIFDRNGDFGEIHLAYSEPTKLWFWGINYNLHTTGGGFSPGVSSDISRCSEKTRERAIISACEQLYKCFAEQDRYAYSQDEAIARAARFAIEEFVLKILGAAGDMAIPDFLATKRIAVQQSLF